MIKLRTIYNEIKLYSNKKLEASKDYAHGFQGYTVMIPNVGKTWINKGEYNWEILDSNSSLEDIKKNLPVPFTSGYDNNNGTHWIKIENKFIQINSLDQK